MFYWIYDISTESLTLLFAAVFVGFTWFGIIFFRPFLRMFVGRRHHTNFHGSTSKLHERTLTLA